jgi:hypothetical protein
MAKSKRQTIQWPKVKDRQYNGQKKKTDNTMNKRKRQTMVNKILHRKRKIEQLYPFSTNLNEFIFDIKFMGSKASIYMYMLNFPNIHSFEKESVFESPYTLHHI